MNRESIVNVLCEFATRDVNDYEMFTELREKAEKEGNNSLAKHFAMMQNWHEGRACAFAVALQLI